MCISWGFPCSRCVNLINFHEVHTLTVHVEDRAVVDSIEGVWRVPFGSGGKPLIPLP